MCSQLNFKNTFQTRNCEVATTLKRPDKSMKLGKKFLYVTIITFLQGPTSDLTFGDLYRQFDVEKLSVLSLFHVCMIKILKLAVKF